MANARTHIRLLGFAAEARLDSLRAALADSAGPVLHLVAIAGLAVVAQTEKGGGLLRTSDKTTLLRRLHAVQRRLELACQAGPFLPADPAAPVIQLGELPRLVTAAAPRLARALVRDGAKQQWDITIRWPAQAVLTPHRAALAAAATVGQAEVVALVARLLRRERDDRLAALRTALSPRVLALLEGQAADTEIALTVLVPAGGETAIEAALGRLPEAASAYAEADLRGPMPPVSFAACALAEVTAGEIAAAWQMLELDGTTDTAALHQSWRRRAAALHPDHTGRAADAERLDAARQAYRLLVPLLDEAGPRGLPDLLPLAGRRLVPMAALEMMP
jgi:hypothetical protein